MASISREVIDKALFALMTKNLPQTVKTVSRRLRHWSDVSSSEKPAVFMTKTGEVVERRKGQPSKITSHYEVYIYIDTGGDMTVIPSELMNPILDALTNSLEPLPSFVTQDLGMSETVSHAFINGNAVIAEGVDGNQAIAIVPIEVLWV